MHSILHNKYHILYKIMAAVFVSVWLLFSGAKMHAYYAEEQPVETEETEQDDKTLIISVVEEIEAEEIEEEDIPLAALPVSKESTGKRHLLLSGALFLMSICYTGYFFFYHRKLMRLKEEAASLEYKRMKEKEHSYES